MITVITGPPCAGKTTYVRDHAKPGDIVIDFDTIARALGSAARWDHDPRLREIAAATWAAAVRAVTRRRDINAWIIDARPLPDRADAYRRARAKVIPLTAPPAELRRRATADGHDAAWRLRRIDEFLKGSRPPGPAGRPARGSSGPAPRPATRW